MTKAEQLKKYFLSIGKRGIQWNIAGEVIGMSKASVSNFITRHEIPMEKIKLENQDKQRVKAQALSKLYGLP